MEAQGFRYWRVWIENTGDSRWLVQKSGGTLFVQPQRPPAFGKFRFGRRHHSSILEEEFHSQSVLLEVKHSQRGSDRPQLPGDRRHHLPKEIIQFGHRGKRVQTTPKKNHFFFFYTFVGVVAYSHTYHF